MENSPGGIPIPVIVIGVGLVIYFIAFRGSSSTAASTSGGGGSITTGNTTIQKGAVTITVQGGDLGTPHGNPQPKPPVHPRKKSMSHTEYKVTAHGKTSSLNQIARRHHTTAGAIAKASTGPGNPHGNAFKRYLRKHDYNAPLPHGTNLDIPKNRHRG